MLNTPEDILGKLHCHGEKPTKTYQLIGDRGCMFLFFFTDNYLENLKSFFILG